jgi:hypothetical protein
MAEHARYNSATFQTAGGFLLGRRDLRWPIDRPESERLARSRSAVTRSSVSVDVNKNEPRGTLSGIRVLVTGGTSGLGRATCRGPHEGGRNRAVRR